MNHIDFATGAIYERKDGTRSELYQQIKYANSQGMPSYIVKKDAIYKAWYDDKNKLQMEKIDENTLPETVRKSLSAVTTN